MVEAIALKAEEKSASTRNREEFNQSQHTFVFPDIRAVVDLSNSRSLVLQQVPTTEEIQLGIYFT